MFINFKKIWQAEENKALDLVLVSIDQHLMPLYNVIGSLNIFQTIFFLFSFGCFLVLVICGLIYTSVF